jgi:hypothetical protein
MNIVSWLGLRVGETFSFPPYLPGDHSHLQLGSRPARRAVPLKMRDADGRIYNARRLWAEMLEPETADCEVLLRYQAAPDYDPEQAGDFFAGAVAVAGRKIGQGYACYAGVWPSEATGANNGEGLYNYLWENLFAQEIRPAIASLPRHNGLEVVRVGTHGQYLALLNHSNQPMQIRLNWAYQELNSDKMPEQITLAPYDVRFLAEY